MPRAITRTRVASFFLLATFFCVTFEKVHWNVAGSLGIADVLTVCFLVSFALTNRGPLPRTAAILLGFFAAFLLVYLLGYFNLETKQALDQFTKGMVKYVLHFLFLIAAVTYLVRRGQTYYWRALAWFTAGFVANCVYGALQLLSARAGHNLDSLVLSPLTGGASAINVYGSVEGTSVYRPNALTGDPNHLGVMLVVPLLAADAGVPAARARAQAEVAARHRARVHAADAARDALAQRRARADRRPARARRPVSALRVVACAARAARRPSRCCSRTSCTRAGTTSPSCLRSRMQTGGGSSSAHFAVYDFVPRCCTRIRCSGSV